MVPTPTSQRPIDPRIGKKLDAPMEPPPLPVRPQPKKQALAEAARPDTRTCSGCNKQLPRSSFHFKDRNSGRLQSRCITCASEYSRRYYRDNAEKVKARARQRNDQIRVGLNAAVNAAREVAACVDCGARNSERPLLFTGSGTTRVVDVICGSRSQRELDDALNNAVVLCHPCCAERRLANRRADTESLRGGPNADMMVVDAIVAALTVSTSPLSFSGITAALAAAGRNDGPRVLRTTLSRLHKAGKVRRVARGLYTTGDLPDT